LEAVEKYFINVMENYTIKLPQKSRVSQKNPYNTTGLTDKTPTSTNKAVISSLSVNFGDLSQDKPNFAAQIALYPVQKINFFGGVWNE
jgi:hypothetical protein